VKKEKVTVERFSFVSCKLKKENRPKTGKGKNAPDTQEPPKENTLE